MEKLHAGGQRRLKKPITTRMYSLESAEDPNLIFRSLDMSNSKAEMWGKCAIGIVLCWYILQRVAQSISILGLGFWFQECRLATYCQSENCKPKMHISLDQCLNTVHALVSTNYSSYRYIYYCQTVTFFTLGNWYYAIVKIFGIS